MQNFSCIGVTTARLPGPTAVRGRVIFPTPPFFAACGEKFVFILNLKVSSIFTQSQFLQV